MVHKRKLDENGGLLQGERWSEAAREQRAQHHYGGTERKRRKMQSTLHKLSSIQSNLEKIPEGGEVGGLSMEQFVLENLLYDIDYQAARLKKDRPHRTYEYAMQNESAGGECEGDRRVRLVREALDYLDRNGYKRSKQQRVMHEGFLNVSYSAYYGKDTARNLLRLLNDSGFSELRQEVLVLAPRRYGKTVSICLFNAAELVTQPDHDVLIYSNNHRASKMMLLQTHRIISILQKNPKFGGRVVSLNKNESMTYRTIDGHTNELFAYPAKPDNLRGTGSKRKTGSVILEEFAYIPLDLVLEIVAPTLTVENKILRCITTVKGADSFVGPMASAKFPDGRSVFLSLNFELVCAECKRKGIPEKCKCLEGDIPHWQSAAQHEKLAVLMKGKIETFMKEIRGYSMDQTTQRAFTKDSVDFLKTPSSVMPSPNLVSDEIYLAVDPACNGKYSKVAIVSGIFVGDKLVVRAHSEKQMPFFSSSLYMCACVFIGDRVDCSRSAARRCLFLRSGSKRECQSGSWSANRQSCARG